MAILNWLISRLKEPSTWAGLAALGMALGLTQDGYEAISGLGMAAAGALAVFLRERPNSE